MKRIVVSILAAAVSLGLVGCANGNKTSDGDAGGKSSKLVAVIAKGYASPFWAAVKKGSLDAGEKLGIEVDFRGPDTESDVDRQVNQLNQVLAKNPMALVFAALDSEAETAALSKWTKKNIPVIAFDSGVPGSDVPLTTVATNNKAAAADAAKHAVELLGGKGEVAIVCHSQTSITGTDRRDGFVDYLKENAPDIKVVDVQYNDSDQAKAQQQADAMVTAHPGLNLIFATDDDGAVGAANVVKQKGKLGDIKVIGFDSGKVQMDMIRNDEIAGSVTQNPYKIGYVAVEEAVKAAKGEKLEKNIDSGFAWYDKNNIDDPKIQEAVYD